MHSNIFGKPLYFWYNTTVSSTLAMKSNCKGFAENPGQQVTDIVFWKGSKNCNCQVTWSPFSIEIILLVVLESLPSVLCSTTIRSDVHYNMTTRNAKLPGDHKALSVLSDIFWLINGEAVAHSIDDICFK